MNKKKINILILCQLSYYENWLIPNLFKQINPNIKIDQIKNLPLSRFFKFLNTIL